MARAAEIEERAAAWLARRDRSDWLAADQAALDSWIAQSTAHRLAFLRLEAALNRVDRLRAVRANLAGLPPALDAPGWRRIAAIAAVAILALGLSWGLLASRFGATRFETAIGGRETIPLADGSRIELNTDSRIEIALDDKIRRVELERGEAYFEVARDPSRPFIVAAGSERVVVLGTKFSVRREADGVRVVVTEGRVRVESEQVGERAPPLQLTSGAIARVANGEALVAKASLDAAEETLSWRSGFLVFRNATLGEVAADFNRYNRTKLVIADPEIAAIPIGGRFRADNLDGFVRLVEQGFPVAAERRGGEIVLSAD